MKGQMSVGTTFYYRVLETYLIQIYFKHLHSFFHMLSTLWQQLFRLQDNLGFNLLLYLHTKLIGLKTMFEFGVKQI